MERSNEILVQLEKTEKGFALLIPAELDYASYVKACSLVDLTLVEDKFVIAPIRRSQYTIDKRLAGVTGDNVHGDTNWRRPVGKEVW